MAKTLPFVISASRSPKATFKHWGACKQGLPPTGRSFEIEVDSADWSAWLEHERSFSVNYYPKASSHATRFTVRPEKRGEHTYWQAWKTIGGKTTKKYLGAASKLTKEKLDQAREWFYEQVEEAETGRESRESGLEKTTEILSSLVLQLVEHCDNPRLVKIAQAEVIRS